MKKFAKCLLALLLIVCTLMSYTLPIANADYSENTKNSVVYDFNQIPYEGGLYTGLGKDEEKPYQLARALQGGEWLTNLGDNCCKLSIPERYALASNQQYALNWTYETASSGMRRPATDEAHLPCIDVRFWKRYGLRSVMDQGQWLAFRIKSPGSGTYAMDMTYYGYTGSGTVAFYILEANGKASLDRETVLLRSESVGNSLNLANRVGKAALYNGTADASNTAFIGNWDFKADKEYIVVMECYESAPYPDNRYVYLTNLTMTPGEKTATADSIEKRIRTQTVQEDLVTVADAGSMAAVWEIDGQDYYFLPIEGGQLLVFNLETWELVRRVETGISYPTSTAVVDWVDDKGNTQTELFIGGNGRRMFGYNLDTGKTRVTDYYHYTSGLQDEHDIRGIDAHNGKVYVGLSYGGHLAEYDPATNKYTDLGDMIAEEFSPEIGEEGEVTGNDNGGIQAIACYGDYLYLTAVSMNTKRIIKYDLVNKKKVAELDISAQVGSNTGTRGLSVLGDGDYLIAGGLNFLGLTLIDLDTFTPVSYEDAIALGLDDNAWNKGVNQMATEVIETTDKNGNKQYKQYFVCTGGVYAYDTLTDRFEKIGGAFNGFNTAGKQSVTLSLNGGEEKLYLFTYSSAGQVRLCEPTVGKKISPEDIMKPEYGTNGAGLRLGTNGEGDDANTIYLGAFNTPGCAAYDTVTGTFTNYRTEGQTDSQVWYNGKLYAGNYSMCVVYQIDMENADNNKAVISNMINYQQKRIHTLAAGDGYVFAGTIPTTYLHGGGIGIYNTITGEEDFIRFKETSVKGEKVVPNKELWDQSVKGLVYSDGLLYGCTSRTGGSGSKYSEGTSAQIFVYDYKNGNILSTLDLRKHIDVLPDAPIDFIGGIAADPVVEGRFWGLVSDVLFTFTFDRNTLQWNVQVVHDQKHTEYTSSGNRAWFNIPIVFDPDSNSIFVCFVSSGVYHITLSDWNTANKASSQRILGDKPLHYTLGADNMLYYLSGSALKAFPVNVTAADWTDPQAWDAQVKAIGKITLNSADAIAAARTAYNALTLRDKGLVQELALLEEMEAALLDLQITEETAALSTASLAALEQLLAQYDSFTSRQKKYVKNYTVLQTAYNEVLVLIEAESGLVAAVQAQINALKVTSLDDAQAVTEAREAYESLTDRQKAMVDTTALTAAEALLIELANAAQVQAQINALPSAPVFADETVISAARAAYNALSAEAKAAVNTENLENAESQIRTLHTIKTQIDALPENIQITDMHTISAISTTYAALTEAQKAILDAGKLFDAQNALSELQRTAVPVTQTYDFAIYKNPDFYTDSVKYPYDSTVGRIPENFYVSKPYNSKYDTIAQWFYANYPKTISWGVETSNSGLNDYMFRGATDQGMRISLTAVDQYTSVRIFVTADGLYTMDLTVGDPGSTFDVYVVPASTIYSLERTSLNAIADAMTAENLVAENLTVSANKSETVGQLNFDQAGDYLVIFKVEVANSKGMSIRNITLTPVVNETTAAAKVGDNYFLSLEDALAYQVENGAEKTVLNQDTEVSDLILLPGSVLDLNGYTLTADSILSYSSSNIMDSSENSAGVLVLNDPDGNMLSSTNCQLPIYDEAAGGYRFFVVSVDSKAITGGNKYWFKVNVENFEEVYKLIEAGSQFDIAAKLSWNGGEATAVADSLFLLKWAAKYASGDDFYITVSAVNQDGLNDFSLIPCVEANNVAICGDEL